MPRTAEDIKALISALEAGGWEVKSYSGRGMYGKQCISVREGDECVSPGDVAKHLFGEEYDGEFDWVSEPLQDSMGLGIVLYWPRYEWPEEETAA